MTSSPLEYQRSFTASGGYSSFVVDVELVRAGEHLAGTAGEQRVELVLDIPNSRAGIRGESLGAPVGGYWRIESNFNNLDPVGLFLGEYNGRPVHLRSDVHLTPDYAVRHADVSGAVGEQELRAHVAPVEAPAYGPTVMSIDGDFDGAVITLLVTVATDLSEAHINGVIGGHTISIDATPSSVSGQYGHGHTVPTARELPAVLHLRSRARITMATAGPGTSEQVKHLAHLRCGLHRPL